MILVLKYSFADQTQTFPIISGVRMATGGLTATPSQDIRAENGSHCAGRKPTTLIMTKESS